MILTLIDERRIEFDDDMLVGLEYRNINNPRYYAYVGCGANTVINKYSITKKSYFETVKAMDNVTRIRKGKTE